MNDSIAKLAIDLDEFEYDYDYYGYVDALSFLIDQKKNHTKYKSLNINPKLTLEQRKVLERVFC